VRLFIECHDTMVMFLVDCEKIDDVSCSKCWRSFWY